MKFWKRKNLPTRDEIRKAVPVKNPAAEDRAGLIAVPLADRKGFFGWLAKKTNAANHVEFELDEIGTFVWGLVDGKRTVAGIAAELAKEYKLNKHEAEASLLEFIDRLRQRGCISLVRK